jgi:hypothetical protein
MNVLTFPNENEWKLSNYFDAKNGHVPYFNPLIETLGQLRNEWN